MTSTTPGRTGRPARLALGIVVLVAAVATPIVALVLVSGPSTPPAGDGARQVAASEPRRSAPTAPAVLYGAIWNAKRDRPPENVRGFLETTVVKNSVDFVLLQEFQDYWKYLRSFPIPGYRLVLPAPQLVGDTQNPILVRRGLVTSEAGLLRLSAGGYGTHGPMYGVSVVVSGIRLVSVHAPLALPWDETGQPTGPEDRVAAYSAMVRTLRLLALHDRIVARSTLFGGDWNATIEEVGRYAPSWLSSRARLTAHEPIPLRGPGHDRIDYLLTSADVSGMTRHGTGGSDHAFMTFEVAVPAQP